MSNRLAHETSPYLLQHADNPVDWYPWGKEALQRARDEDKPILLSIGYSACHWCHVMAHESFEDQEIAAILNEHFVSVKVDREERPDVDRIYITAVQALNGNAGWPLNVFITSDGQPFYGGTYFPPAPRYGMPSFRQVLAAIVEAWRSRRDELLAGGAQLAGIIRRQMAVDAPPENESCQWETLEAALEHLRASFDHQHGGWGRAPKFPQPMVLEFLLRSHHRSGDERTLQMVEQTLETMARGGIYDQLGGGFHRYSVDAQWTTPHFEKMLYDNAQLARVYLHAWQVTGKPLYRAVVEETLDYLLREMADPAGGFYSTQDADSEGKEGKFFLWTPAEVRAVLGDEAERFIAAYGLTEQGNFEGRNILEWKGTVEERQALGAARRRLLAARQERVHPGRDDKVLTSWNGLALAALAEAARVLGRDDYRLAAERNGEFLLRALRTPNGRLRHTWKDGVARVDGYLEDHACLAEGLLELYQSTFDSLWYVAALETVEMMIAHFSAPVGFYDTADDQEKLLVRPRELQDNAVPSGNGMAVTVLLKLDGLAVDPRYGEMAWQSLCAVQPLLADYGLAFGQWLCAQSYLLSSPWEVAIVGDLEAADMQALLAAVGGYRPHQVVAVGPARGGLAAVPLLRDRPQVGGRATAYVCVDGACRAPVTEPGEVVVD